MLPAVMAVPPAVQICPIRHSPVGWDSVRNVPATEQERLVWKSLRESQHRAAGHDLGRCALRLDDCSAQDTDGCPKPMWDGVEHEHQLSQACKVTCYTQSWTTEALSKCDSDMACG